MSDTYVSAVWTVREGAADQFVERWRDFLGWTRETHTGLESGTLLRSDDDPNRFISFASWKSADDRVAWQQSEGFAQRFAACRELCDDFLGGDHRRMVTV